MRPKHQQQKWRIKTRQILLPLFYNLQHIIRASNFYRKYQLIFQALDLSSIRDTNTGVGRTGYSRHAMLRAFIVKHLEGIKSVPRLIAFRDAQPVLTEMCGFDMGCLPDEAQFYKFLASTNTSLSKNLHHAVNKKLIAKKVVSLTHFLIDSKPVMAATRENNFKNPHRNPRHQQTPKTFGPHGCPLCDANLEMASAGTWSENLRMRAKFRCPIKASRSFAKQYPHGCPVQHISFSEDNACGCTKYLDITDDARSRVPRDSAFFKQTFALRTESERYFARLGDREVEPTTHDKLRAIHNQMAIAHLSMSLVAAAAAILLERPERIRCCRTFAASNQPQALAG